MKKLLIILLLAVFSSVLYGQGQDYVILKSAGTLKPDTVFGQVIIPENGIISKAKILTADGKEKYHPNIVIGFKCKDKYFASVPYNSAGNVFAERIVSGKIDLCYYDTNPKGYNNGLAGVAAASLTSYYFIKPNTKNTYLRVPHSREKAREEISLLFKDNFEITHSVLSEDFRVWKLPEIVKQYNDQK